MQFAIYLFIIGKSQSVFDILKIFSSHALFSIRSKKAVIVS